MTQLGASPYLPDLLLILDWGTPKCTTMAVEGSWRLLLLLPSVLSQVEAGLGAHLPIVLPEPSGGQ